jgi:hypothetical protein
MGAWRGIAAGTALWAGALAPFLVDEARAETASDGSLTVARICVYGTRGSAAVVGGNAPIRCEPPAGAEPPSPRPADPASNPVGAVPQAMAPAGGTERVWEDGRVNPGRGVPRPVSGPVVLGASAPTSGAVPPP